MAITMDGIYVNGQKVTFAPEDILSGDASAYTEEIGTAVEEWLEENVTGGEQVTDTTLTLPGVPADAEVTGDKIDELKEDLNVVGVIPIPMLYPKKYYDTSGNTIDISTRASSNNFDCTLVECSAGDQFTVTATGYSDASLPWAFIDSSGNVLLKASDKRQVNALITAPAASAYLIINNRKADTPNAVSYYGANIGKRVTDVEANLEIVNAEMAYINYNYDAEFERAASGSATDSTQIGVKRVKNFVTLTATKPVTRIVFIRISGDVQTTVLSDTVESWATGVTLEEGHTYRAICKLISGTEVVGKQVSASVYRAGEHRSVGSLTRYSNMRVRTFTADTTDYNISLYVPKDMDFTENTYLVTLEEVLSEGVDDTFGAEIADTLEKVRTATSEPSLVFPWVTDIHRYSTNAGGVQNFEKMISNIKDIADAVPVDFILNTGDQTDGNKVQEVTLTRSYTCLKDFMSLGLPYLFCIGNHDTNYYGNGSERPYLFTAEEVYKAYFTASKSTAYNANENGMDYYVDFNDLGVRLIIICANNVYSNTREYAYGTTTAAWLATALDTDKKVIIAVHQSPIPTQCYKQLETRGYADVVSAIQTYVNNGGNPIMISGHSHRDIAFVNPWLSVMEVCQRFCDDNTEDVIITPTDEENPTEITGFIDNIVYPAREAQTASEDAWTVCVYKPRSDELDLIRFGAGHDRYFHCTPITPTTVTSKLTGTLTWSSSDASVATVSGGVITGVGTGRCAILAKDDEGNYECWIVER